MERSKSAGHLVPYPNKPNRWDCWQLALAREPLKRGGKTISAQEREQRFRAVVNEICRLFDDSNRDPGAVLRVEMPQWRICGARGVKSDSPDWCYSFPPTLLDRESPRKLAQLRYDDYQAA